MLSRSLTLVCLSTLLPASALAQSTQSSFWGSSADLRVGTSMDEVGDINGDGYIDMVVGAPCPSGTGRIYFVSGKYLETGVGGSTLGSTFAGGAGGLFGSSVLSVGDVSGDGIADVVVTADISTFPTTSKAYLVSGASKTVLGTLNETGLSTYQFGVARCGDVNGDGYTDFAIQKTSFGVGYVELISARGIALGASNPVLASITSPGSADGFGTGLSAGDFDGDGKPEIVVGAPGTSKVYVFRGTTHTLLRTLSGPGASRFGQSLDATRDVDGDGRKDLVVGAPNSDAGATDGGEAMLFNGKRIATNSPPFDDASWPCTQASAHFGTAVCFTSDMNTDLVTDIVVGAPDYDSVFLSNGRVFLYSGETSHLLGTLSGAVGGEHLGASVSRASDFNGDYRTEIAAGAPLSNHGATDGGLVRFVDLFPALPSTYCVAKVNSLGCTPAISSSGSASLTSSSSFLVKASNVINNKAGLLIYAFAPGAAPLQGSTLCLSAPIKRYGAQISTGNPPPNDCSGKLSVDFNVLIQSGTVNALNLAGQQVFAQYWSRDPAAVAGSSLTNALAFVVNP
ncbi:MAG TPA: FG-GAP-like repeat-containing protein [Planctomycetota bacterium]|nr:FG-GAP-like repeat-containing protein [Planctomycetota bacterium]